MQKTATAVPNNIKKLKSVVLDQVLHIESLAHQNTQLLAEVARIKAQVFILQEQLNLALAKRYAASSEKRSPDQIRLFNEAEVDVAADGVAADDAGTSGVIAEHARQKRGRKPLPGSLPRLDVIHELPEAERYCDHDGAALVRIGAVISEQLDIIPATIRVLRHIRVQYACGCGQCIKTAPLFFLYTGTLVSGPALPDSGILNARIVETDSMANLVMSFADGSVKYKAANLANINGPINWASLLSTEIPIPSGLGAITIYPESSMYQTTPAKTLDFAIDGLNSQGSVYFVQAQ